MASKNKSTCHLEVGSAHNQWWWRMACYIPRVTITGDNMMYGSKALAVRAAKDVATRFGLDIQSITRKGDIDYHDE